MARSYDNLAYDLNMSAAPAYNPAKSQPKIRIKTVPKAKAKVKYNYAVVIRIGIITLFAFAVLFRGVMINEKTAELSEMKAQLEDIEAKNQKLQVDIEQSLDLNRIEKLASGRLNMRRPEKYQIVYINLDRVDYVEKINEEKNPAVNATARLFSSIRSYLD